MRKGVWLILSIAFVMSLTTPRLPAPIVEEASPTPKRKPIVKATPKSKPKPTPPPRPSPPRFSFAGTWSGNYRALCDDLDFSSAITLIISADEHTLTWQSAGTSSTRPCSRNGDMLQWQENNFLYTFQKNGDGRTAVYSCRYTVDGSPCSLTGVLSKH